MEHRLSLWGDVPQPRRIEAMAPGACVLRAQVREQAGSLLEDVAAVLQQAPLRHMRTRGGQIMSVAMSNCGTLGWTSDLHGYAYMPHDPLTGQAWPPMPAHWRALAQTAALAAGFTDFEPEVCLINRYRIGARMGLHQDRDEQALRPPIVSVSLGWPGVFLWGGSQRSDPVQRVPLLEGDVVVWGDAARLNYHGVGPVPEGPSQRADGKKLDPEIAASRINLTFRQVHHADTP